MINSSCSGVGAVCSESTHSCQLRLCVRLSPSLWSLPLSVFVKEEARGCGGVAFSLMINLQSFKYLLSRAL